MRSKFFTLTLTLASAAIAAVALAAIPAVAAPTTTKNLKVPFSFTVNGKECPAGVYMIQRNAVASTLMLQSRDSSRSFMWIAGPSDTTTGGSVVLSFDQIGETHFLRSVQSGSLLTHRLDKDTVKNEAVTVQVTPGQ
jgi:hypothetical protein